MGRVFESGLIESLPPLHLIKMNVEFTESFDFLIFMATIKKLTNLNEPDLRYKTE